MFDGDCASDLSGGFGASDVQLKGWDEPFSKMPQILHRTGNLCGKSARRFQRPGGGELNVSAVFASYRAAGTNAGNEPERNGSVELSETRKLDGTQ